MLKCIQRSPRPIAGFKGPTSKRREGREREGKETGGAGREKIGRGGDGRGREGRGEEGRRGREGRKCRVPPPTFE